MSNMEEPGWEPPRHPDRADTTALVLNGAELIMDPSGAALWSAQLTLVVADLHFEKGSAHALRGSQLPPYDTRTTLARLAGAISRFRPKRVICVGDSFHDADADQRLSAEDRQQLDRLIEGCDWVWILGNHDPRLTGTLGGRQLDHLTLGPLHFRHEARHGPVAGEISGHFHPKAGLSVRGRYLSGRCFVSDGKRLILPAFGAYAGGLDVRDPAISRHFPGGFKAFVIGRRKLHRIHFRVASAPD